MGDCVAVLGGDVRFSYLAQWYKQQGKKVLRGGCLMEEEGALLTEELLKSLHFATQIVLPMPPLKNKMLNTPAGQSVCMEQLLKAASPKTKVFAGLAGENMQKLCRDCGLELLDYATPPCFLWENALLTAEGVIQIALEHTPHALNGSRCLVVGYGKCGKALAQRLLALGAKVTVAARSEEALCTARLQGLQTVEFCKMEKGLSLFDLVVNTVPAPVFNEQRLKELNKDCLLLDIASAPGGVDRVAAQRLEIPFVWALSLPGKTAPKTAAHIIQKSIDSMISQRRE